MAKARDPATPGPPPWREVFQGPRGRLTTGLLLLEALVAIEMLVITTILPAVRRDIGGIQYYGWAFSAFGLATFAAIPIAGRATDRAGTRPVLTAALGFYGAGLLISGLAPSMPILVLGRFVQGCGGGALYVVSLGAVAKSYPERIRPQVFALLASMWILPGVIGPPIGALFASTIGWRWAFLAPIPVMALAVLLVGPAMSTVPVRLEPVDEAHFPVRWPLQLMAGAGLLLAGLTEPSRWSFALVPAGLVAGLPAVVRVTPRGSLRARVGLPAAAAAAFLLSAAFSAVDGFVPLMLTEVRGLSVGLAGIAVTLVTMAWSAGSWWQSKRFDRFGARRLVTIGASFVAAGTLLLAVGLVDLPVAAPYVGYMLTGIGMGIAFPTIPLAVMGESGSGSEGRALSGTILMDYLGVGIGSGLGGACIAVSHAAGARVEFGIGGAFAIGLVAAIALVLIAGRIPEARPVDSAT